MLLFFINKDKNHKISSNIWDQVMLLYIEGKNNV